MKILEASWGAGKAKIEIQIGSVYGENHVKVEWGSWANRPGVCDVMANEDIGIEDLVGAVRLAFTEHGKNRRITGLGGEVETV